MPFTWNGIGTRYCGKKNIIENRSYCDRCAEQKILVSYLTRVWLVLLYIPVLPLWKRKIIDHCQTCTHHYAVSMTKWRQVKQDAIQSGLEEMKSRPGDGMTALQMHRKLLAFEEPQKARGLADAMAVKFSREADLQVYLGDYYDDIGDPRQADTCYQSALRVAPDDLRIREAVGISQIRRGDPDKASELLSFMIQSDDYRDSQVLFLLARAYAERNNHLAAFEIYRILRQDHPSMALSDMKFRKAVATTESVLGRKESILPRRKFRFQRWMGWSVAAAAIGLGGFWINLHMMGDQNLVIFNHLNARSVITFDEDRKVVLAPYTRSEIKIAEGRHDVSVETPGCPADGFDFLLENNWFQRMAGDSVFVLNIRGNAILLYEKTTYQEDPDPQAVNPYRLFVGERFVTLRDIDFKFAEFPETLQISDGSSVTRSRVGHIDADVFTTVNIMQDEQMPLEKILAYIETNLQVSPQDDHLVDAYVQRCIDTGLAQRSFDFLEADLQAGRSIDWHRWYQTLGIHYVGEENRIGERYRQMLDADPENADLLYLVGRIQDSSAVAQTYYDRAMAIDPEHPYPKFAKAYQLFGCGRIKASRALYAEACRLKPESRNMSHWFYQVRLALKEYAALKAEVAQSLSESPADWSSFSKMMELLALGGETREMHTALAVFKQSLKAENPEDPYQVGLFGDMRLAYLMGNTEHYVKAAGALNDSHDRNKYLRRAYLLQGNMAAAEKTFSEDRQPNGYTALLFWYGWQRAGDASKAAQWLGAAREIFNQSPGEERHIAGMLNPAVKDIVQKLDDISIYPPNKAILYAVMGVLHPEQKKVLFARAQKLNYKLSFPHHLIRQVTAAKH